MTFTKVCKICNKEFESESRNTSYCSDKCAKRGAKKAYRRRKMKHINSPTYKDDKEIMKLVSKARAVSREIATAFLPIKCSCTDPNHECDGELQCHHIDHNPFNMHPSNLRWLCTKAHAALHAKEEDCNILEEMKAFAKIKEQAEIRARNKEKQSSQL